MELQTEWFQDGAASKKVLEAGSYVGTLVRIKPGSRTSFDGQGMKPCLTFVFETESGAQISRTVTASRVERSACMGLIRAIAGAKQPAPEVVGDSKKLQAFLLDLVGNSFLIQTEPSKCARFNNLLTATPQLKNIPDMAGEA